MEEESLSLKKNGLFLVGLLIAVGRARRGRLRWGRRGQRTGGVPSSSCTAIEYEGDGNPDYLIVSDLPLQGASRTQTLQINDAIRYQLKSGELQGGRLQDRLPGVRRRNRPGR